MRGLASCHASRIVTRSLRNISPHFGHVVFCIGEVDRTFLWIDMHVKLWLLMSHASRFSCPAMQSMQFQKPVPRWRKVNRATIPKSVSNTNCMKKTRSCQATFCSTANADQDIRSKLPLDVRGVETYRILAGAFYDDVRDMAIAKYFDRTIYPDRLLISSG